MQPASSLKIQPLSKDDLALYLMEDELYEKKYNLNAWGRTVPAVMREMMVNGTLPGIDICSPQQIYFFTLWIAIDESTYSVVAEFQIKGIPDQNGWVEIGYETFEPFQRKGYMAEVIEQMKEWGRNQQINGFVAETHQSNTASIQLLKKLGFKPAKQKQQVIVWKCKL